MSRVSSVGLFVRINLFRIFIFRKNVHADFYGLSDIDSVVTDFDPNNGYVFVRNHSIFTYTCSSPRLLLPFAHVPTLHGSFIGRPLPASEPESE